MLHIWSLLLFFVALVRISKAGGVTISSNDWATLSDSLDGYVVLPTDDSYDSLYVSWAATYDDTKPEAVVFCQSENDVVTVINFILEHEASDGSVMNFVVRSGAHNVAGWSCTDGLLIDLSGLDQLYISDDGTAIVGPGVSLSVFTKFAEENDFTIPHGDCASVCFGGFLHGGGFGLISRTFGMGIDWIKSVNVVLPTGDLVSASDDDENYSDLFWGIRGGGGGNFGIVTQFEMNIPEKKQKNPGLYLEISWDYSSDMWSLISSTWNSFVEDSSYETHFAVYLRITPVTYITKDYYIQLHGFWTGEQVDGLMAVAKLLDKIGVTPTEAKIDYVSFEGWIESSSSSRLRYSSHCSSRFAFDVLNDKFFESISSTLQEMIDYDNYADSTDTNELTYGVPTEFLFIAPAGGAISYHTSDETAFPWRDATYLFVVCARYMSEYENSYNFVEEWIVSTMSTLEPFLSDKSFINFPDNNLANWQTSFYGENYPRLQNLKAKYDPNNVFNFQFSIEQPDTTVQSRLSPPLQQFNMMSPADGDKTLQSRPSFSDSGEEKKNKKSKSFSSSLGNENKENKEPQSNQRNNDQLEKNIKKSESNKKQMNPSQKNDKSQIKNIPIIQTKEITNTQNGIWSGIALIIFSIAIIFMVITKCFKKNKLMDEYTPVNNRQSMYNTI